MTYSGLRRLLCGLGERALARDGHDRVVPRPDTLEAVEEIRRQLRRARFPPAQQQAELGDGEEGKVRHQSTPR
jgi:hypothetical protein